MAVLSSLELMPMLAFARRQELKAETIHVPELIRGMTDKLQRSLGQSVSIETRFPLVLRPICADANQVEMALLNLAVCPLFHRPRPQRCIAASDAKGQKQSSFENKKAAVLRLFKFLARD